MICKYFADDGTEFNDYDECEAYERRMKTIYTVTLSRFWKENGAPITLEEFIHEPENCDYMEVANEREAEIIKEFCRNDAGIMAPWTYQEHPASGRYYYRYSDEEWHNLDEEMGEFKKILKIFGG